MTEPRNGDGPPPANRPPNSDHRTEDTPDPGALRATEVQRALVALFALTERELRGVLDIGRRRLARLEARDLPDRWRRAA